MTDDSVLTTAALVADSLNLRRVPRFRGWTNVRGHGGADAFSLPRWIAEECDAYQVYYIVHEVCHALHLGHGKDFKRAERAALANLGLTITYRRAYAATLSTLAGGPLWKHSNPWD